MKNVITILMLTFAINCSAQSFYDIINGAKQVINTTREATNTSKEVVGAAKDMKGAAGQNKGNSSSANSNNNSNASASTSVAAAPAPAIANKTNITLQQCSYDQLKEILTALKSNSAITNIEKAFSGNSATISVTHSGSTDNILDYIETNASGRYNVMAFQSGSITLGVKQRL